MAPPRMSYEEIRARAERNELVLDAAKRIKDHGIRVPEDVYKKIWELTQKINGYSEPTNSGRGPSGFAVIAGVFGLTSALALLYSGLLGLRSLRVPYSDDENEKRTQRLYDAYVGRPDGGISRLLALAQIIFGAVLGSEVAYNIYRQYRPAST
ncbi:MAG: hypothetical protein QXY45_03915 [Candidatus Aenigmatarchaeota archaeon]